MLVRRRRARDDAWAAARSWLGGRPRLGPLAWPRDPVRGTPLPFAAQIDLAELAEACPDGPLAAMTGSLAFFLGAGAAVHVPAGRDAEADAPSGLLPACLPGREAFPARASRLASPLFPRWPVEPVAIAWPEVAAAGDGGPDADAVADAVYAALDGHVAAGPGDGALGAAGLADLALDGSEDMWWHAAHLVRAGLLEAGEQAPALIGRTRRALDAACDQLAATEDLPFANPTRRLALEQDRDAALSLLKRLEAEAEALPGMVWAMDEMVCGRPPWQRMTVEELDVFLEAIAWCHDNCPLLVADWIAREPAALNAACLRAMMTGDAEAIAAMPEAMLVHRNRHFRLTGREQHQLFGLPARQPVEGSPADGRAAQDDVLLLQLACDEEVEWRFGAQGLYQFRIAPGDLAAGRFDRVRLSFEDLPGDRD